MKLFEEFKRLRKEHPADAAFLLTSGDRYLPITWRQFTDDIAIISWIIENYAPGGVIGLIGENSYEWMATHAACLFSGATVVPIDVNLSADEIAARLRTVSASVLVHSALYAEKSRAVATKMPGLATGGFGSRKTDFFLEAGRKAIACGLKTIWDRESVDTSKTSMIVFTSGTTAEPRGAEQTIRAIETFIECWSPALKMESGSRSLMLLPLYHIFGICTAYAMLASGVALGVCPDFRRIYDAVERFRVNFIFLVPALAEILAAKIAQHGRSAEEALGTPIDWILTGGAPQPRRTFERLQTLGVKVLTGYGLTETAAVFSVAPFDQDPHVGSAGRAVQHPEVETKVSERGELLVRGPNVMKGYYHMPEKTAAVIDKDGWFHTGDIGHIDEDGYVWITGRASRTIVLSSGKKIAPEELEEKLLSMPGVLEALVTGDGATRTIQAELYGSVPEASLRKSVDALNLMLPVYKRISKVVVRQEPFPRTSSGKIKTH